MMATSPTTSGQNTSGIPANNDAALVARIAAREEAALREAIAMHAQRLNNIAYRMLGQRQDAEDVVQEAMLRLWDHAPRLAEKGAEKRRSSGAMKLGGWLKRVTVNLAIDRIRAARRISGEEVPERADQDPLADEQIEAEEANSAAKSLIAELPERQRAAIVLTYYEELPNAEAAGVMDMKLKAFESLLHRARGALRKAFEAQQADTGEVA